MKKILFASYSLDVGGIETALVTLLNYLADKGEKYDITLMLEKKQGVFMDKLPKNIKIITYEPSTIKIKLIRKIANYIKQLSFKVKYKNKFDTSICYATYSFPCSFVARNASKNPVLWVHNDYLNFYNNDINQYKLFFKKLKVEEFRKIVFVSNYGRKSFTAIFPEFCKKTILCNNLIDYKTILEKSNEKVKDLKDSMVVTFINIGRHNEKQKKISRIINATRKLNKQGYKFRVLLVGKGIDTRQYQNMSKDLKNIIFLGFKKNPYPYLIKSNCLLLSSPSEGYPVVFVEAQILGKPIVTTDVSDSKKDIEGKYGIVTDNSEDGVYEGMKRFLDEGFIPNEFSAEEYNKDIMKKIEKIID